MDIMNKTIAEEFEQEREYLREVFEREAGRIHWDEDYAGWCVGGEYVEDYLFNNENTFINPKELGEMIEEIIEDEMKFKRGDDMMIDQITAIIKKYKDVELITVPEHSYEMEFELYDYLDKPGNFEDDIENIIHEIQPVIPTTYTVSHKYCNDEYWNGEEMTESNLSCTITVKRVRKYQ